MKLINCELNFLEDLTLFFSVRGADFSDSIGKPSVLASRATFEVIKKHGSTEGEVEEHLETPLQRFERLRAEVTGFLRDIEAIRSTRAQAADSIAVGGGDDLDSASLAEMADRLKTWQSQLQSASKADGGLDSITQGSSGSKGAAQSELTTQLLGKISALKSQSDSTASGSASAASGTSSGSGNAKGLVSYELVYNKDTGKELKLAQVAELERRLAALEQCVTGRIAPEPAHILVSPQGLVASIDEVRHKVTSLDERAMDQLSHRMAKLTKQLEAMKAVREANRTSEGEDNTNSNGDSGSQGQLTVDQEAKIDSVYRSLSQVETVAAELPVVVERMVQLRVLHEQAVHFSAQLTSISSSQSDLSTVLQANLAGINRMQASLTANMATIEKNVLSLEKRIADVSTLLSK